MNFIYLIVLYLIRVSLADIYDLDDVDYKRMPPPFELDDYEECMREDELYCTLEMEVVSNESSELYTTIKEYSKYIGHYNYSLPIRGICASERCESIKNSTNRRDALQSCVGQAFYEKYKLMVSITDFTCFTSNMDVEINYRDIIVAVLLVSIFLLNIIGTLCDFYFASEEKNIGVKLLLCFSLIRNWWKLTAPAADGPEERLRALKGSNGIKFISILLVMFGHSSIAVFCFIDNPRFVENMYKSSIFRISFGSVMVVQIFFLVSGFLLSYNLQLVQEKRPLRWTIAPMAIVKRWFRLTPPYAVAIAVFCTLFKFVGFGPLRPLFITREVDDCNKYWWRHLLYINNLYKDGEYCFPHSWYLDIDTQMFIVGVIICVFFKSGRAKSVVLSILFLLAFVLPPMMIYYKDLDSLFMVSPKTYNDKITTDVNMINIHMATECNAFTYLLGLALGLTVYKLQQDNFDLGKYKKYGFFLWMLVPVGYGITTTFGIFYQERPRLPLYIRMLYGALVIPLYGLVLAIGILLYMFTNNAAFRAILEWEQWTVPSRLSYSAYIVHMILIKTLIVSRQVLQHASFIFTIQNILWCMVLSYAVAVPLWFLVEAPFMQLSKLFMSQNDVPSNEIDMKNGVQHKDEEKCEGPN